MRRSLAAALVACIPVVAAYALGDARPTQAEELRRLYDARDYFALRDRLAELRDGKDPEARFFRAAVQNAFNEPGRSNDTIRPLLQDRRTPQSLVARLLILKRRNDIRLFRYHDAAVDAAGLLAVPGVDPEEMEDARNERKLLEALSGVPPQKTTRAADSAIRLERSAMGGRCVPVRIGSFGRCFITDTGANFSVLMSSEASALGLRVRPAGVSVGSATDARVTADAAVADRLTLGRIEYRNVAFLVLPDKLLSFPDGGRIPGIIGFPLIEAMGQIGFRRDGVLEVPKTAARHTPGTIALDGLTIITPVRYQDATGVCRVDSGAGRTNFYEPFFQRFRTQIERTGRPGAVKVGGAGGIREIPAFTLPSVDLQVAGRPVHLRNVDVYTKPVTTPAENRYFCNLGLDVLEQSGEYIVNFKTMSLVFGEPPASTARRQR